jgi:hypothetical protein
MTASLRPWNEPVIGPLQSLGKRASQRLPSARARTQRHESALLPEGPQTAWVTVLEFWPDHGQGRLRTDGKPADLTSLGMDQHLVEQVTAWNAAYEEDKVPIECAGDAAGLREGRRLLHEIRAELGPSTEFS